MAQEIFGGRFVEVPPEGWAQLAPPPEDFGALEELSSDRRMNAAAGTGAMATYSATTIGPEYYHG